MALDEPRNPFHAELVVKPPEDLSDPEWLRLARAQEAAEARAREADYRERVELESVAAEEARWSSRMRHAAADREAVHYDGSPGWGRAS